MTEILSSTEFWLGALIGGFVGAVVEEVLKRTVNGFISHRRTQSLKSRWEAADRAWKAYESLAYRLKVIQSGWKDGAFVEENLHILLGNDYRMPDEIRERLYEPNEAIWQRRRLQNNELVGVSRLTIYRTSEEVATDRKVTHKIQIQAQRYKYYDFLATHKVMFSGSNDEVEFLGELIGDRPHYENPVAQFPNPLSIGLSLFCENDGCLVLTARTKTQAAGGHLLGGRIFNAVGENMNSTDVLGLHQGLRRLSPWLTGERGLREEFGIAYRHGLGWSLVLHSMVWDSRILDYKIFGYVTTDLSRAEVKQLWLEAPDRSETKGLRYLDTGNRTQCRSIVETIRKEREMWASEAVLCTIRSLLHLGKISDEDLK